MSLIPLKNLLCGLLQHPTGNVTVERIMLHLQRYLFWEVILRFLVSKIKNFSYRKLWNNWNTCKRCFFFCFLFFCLLVGLFLFSFFLFILRLCAFIFQNACFRTEVCSISWLNLSLAHGFNLLSNTWNTSRNTLSGFKHEAIAEYFRSNKARTASFLNDFKNEPLTTLIRGESLKINVS